MAPKVGLEPTTDRLTADCSTIELLWIPIEGSFYGGMGLSQTDFGLSARNSMNPGAIHVT